MTGPNRRDSTKFQSEGNPATNWQRLKLWSQPSHWFQRRSIGERGEIAAARFLRRAGLKILTTGYRNRLGEIDIIALDGDTLVFVEVKTRRDHSAGHPAEAVDDRKQQQIVRLAAAFCRRHGATRCRCRFDVVAVTWANEASRPIIEHTPSAFFAPAIGIR